LVCELKLAGGIVGRDLMSFDGRARSGDELHLECEILEVRPSKSRTDQGLDDAEPEQQSLFRSRSAMFPFPGEPPRTTEKSKVRNWATRSRVADLAGCSNPKV
jgi:hypothetical protein